MRILLHLMLLVATITVSAIASADPQRGIRNYQGIMAGQKKIEQLSKVELQEVLTVHKTRERQRVGVVGGSSRPSYEIEISHNDEFFVINDEKFEARTFCFNMEEGDRVIFVDGSPLGACVSATLINLRTKQKCEVWCE